MIVLLPLTSEAINKTQLEISKNNKDGGGGEWVDGVGGAESYRTCRASRDVADVIASALRLEYNSDELINVKEMS